MDKCFNKSVNNILKIAENEMLSCHHPYVGTEHLLLSLLKNENIKKICLKFDLNYKNFKNKLISTMGKATLESKYILYTPLLKLIIDKAYNKAYDDNKTLDEFYLFSSLLEEEEGIAKKIIENMNIDVREIVKEINKPHLIYELGVSLNNDIGDKIYLREKEINEVIEILLRKNKNNPMLIGHSGVGKTAIVEELARKIKEGSVPDKLKGYEIVMINTSSLIAGTKYRGEFEARLNNVVKEIKKCGNIILFIDEIHTIVKTGASDGSIDAANILKPYLARGEIKVIGATTIDEYNNYIKKDPALVRRFSTVKILEPSIKDMKYIMLKIKKNYEEFYNLTISNKAINKIINITNKYLLNSYNPDKSIELLDQVCSKKVLLKKNTIVDEIDIDSIVLEKINKCNNLDVVISNLSAKLRGKYNEELVKNIVNLIKDKSLNKYMFLNGKDSKNKLSILNYISKKLNINEIVIDCREYSDEYNMARFFNNNYLYNLLEEYPFSFIIFNNYNDANKIFYNMINNIVSNGYIVNNNNQRLFLNNSILFILNNVDDVSLGFNSNNTLLFAS